VSAIKTRNPNRDKSFEIFKENQGKITNKEIANRLKEKIKNIEYWRTVDDWNGKYNAKGGAPKGNQNALGHKGTAPEGNQNARIHGFYSKLMPSETYNIFESIEDMSPLEILWTNIKIKYAAILRAQKIMFVKDQEDITKELKKTKSQSELVQGESIEVYREEEYEIQFAWDKQANFLRAQSTAMGQLTNMIKKYDEMIHANWDTATEEQKLRVDKLKLQLENNEFKHKKEVDKKKIELEREKFDHQKKQDELKNF
jgi:phage terminase small subunit